MNYFKKSIGENSWVNNLNNNLKTLKLRRTLLIRCVVPVTTWKETKALGDRIHWDLSKEWRMNWIWCLQKKGNNYNLLIEPINLPGVILPRRVTRNLHTDLRELKVQFLRFYQLKHLTNQTSNNLLLNTWKNSKSRKSKEP